MPRGRRRALRAEQARAAGRSGATKADGSADRADGGGGKSDESDDRIRGASTNGAGSERAFASHPSPSAPDSAAKTDPARPVCPICLHAYEPGETSRHHAVPKSRGGRTTTRLCVHCHKQIHALFTEKELEREHPSVESLLATEPIRRWAAWIRRRKPTGRVRAFRSGRVASDKKRRRG